MVTRKEKMVKKPKVDIKAVKEIVKIKPVAKKIQKLVAQRNVDKLKAAGYKIVGEKLGDLVLMQK